MRFEPIMRPHQRRAPRHSERLIAQLRPLLPAEAELTLVRQRDWASITFSGWRYYFAVQVASATVDALREALAGALPAQEFALTNAFVADALVLHAASQNDGVGALAIEILVIDECD
jgi:hypothetical protein